MAERLTPRQRARIQTIDEIKRLAREQLARQGSTGLSLRELARELGVVSSAVYRYFPGRDELLTELIVDAYDAAGGEAETAAAAASAAGLPPEEQWLAIGRAIRAWALAHPSEYALIFGSPVPGYEAPGERTVPAATRIPIALMGLLRVIAPPPPGRPLDSSLAADLARIRRTTGIDVPDELMVAGLAAWSFLFGIISQELFGHFHHVVTDLEPYFELQMRRIATSLGLNVAAGGATN